MGITSRWGRARTFAVAGAAAATGIVLAVGAAPAGAVAPRTLHTISANYKCTATIPIVGTKSWTGAIKVSGLSTAKVAPAGAVSVTGWQVTVTIPQSLVDEAAQYATSIGGKLTVYDLTATDSKVATINAAGKGIALPTKTITTTSPAITLKLPATPTNVKGWTAVKAGTMTFSTGKATLALTAVTSFGNVSVPVTCTASPAAVLSKTTVS